MRGELRLVSDSTDSERGRWVDEPYEDPRRSSIPFRPPERPDIDGLWGIGNPRESTCGISKRLNVDSGETYLAGRSIAHEGE